MEKVDLTFSGSSDDTFTPNRLRKFVEQPHGLELFQVRGLRHDSVQDEIPGEV